MMRMIGLRFSLVTVWLLQSQDLLLSFDGDCALWLLMEPNVDSDVREGENEGENEKRAEHTTGALEV